jgi:hypothetical protein
MKAAVLVIKDFRIIPPNKKVWVEPLPWVSEENTFTLYKYDANHSKAVNMLIIKQFKNHCIFDNEYFFKILCHCVGQTRQSGDQIKPRRHYRHISY